MEDDEDVCNTRLDLGIGLSDFVPKRDRERKNKSVFCLDLSVPLHSSDHAIEGSGSGSGSSNLKVDYEDDKEASKDTVSNEYEDTNYGRKKLRLSKEQIILLEDTFKRHTTLNMVQKQTLSVRLNLKPRQVEVWFQNRRARMKLKQTEMDYEFLKKHCERLNEENRRLNKELVELQSAVKVEQTPPKPPFVIQIPKTAIATLTICPSCEKIGKNRGGGKEEAAADVMEVVHIPKQKHNGLKLMI
ncbi:homeobox-leucine zipper protein HAT22-like [Olea europaea var. sylvestris]|uniref:homeobox-leucine zipper protein HAT22-like n=1 Tax=Olea europaea var. sylvestris TaxID=158386 RepID=UPI000C1D1F8D|nr:homeobox-leucine zipper protein HAT22-like [Olea europaea var. sylvestris]